MQDGLPEAETLTKEATVSPEEFLAGLDPWRHPPVPAGLADHAAGITRSAVRIYNLPRCTKRDFTREAGLIAGAGSLAICAGCTSVVLAALQAFADNAPWPSDYGVIPLHWYILMLLSMICLVAATVILPVYIYRRIHDAMLKTLLTAWETTYRETCLRLAETNLGVLICDDRLWSEVIGGFGRASLFNVIGLRPPKDPEETVRMGAAFWPYLLQYQEGDREAWQRGVIDSFPRFLSSGQPDKKHLGSYSHYWLQARMAAIADFLADPPERLPCYRNPVKSETAAERYAGPRRLGDGPRGFDYRLRGSADRVYDQSAGP